MKWYQNKAIIILMLILFFPVGLFLMWKHTNWSTKTKGIISLIIAVFVLAIILSPNQKEEADIPNTSSTSTTSTTSTTKESSLEKTEKPTSPTTTTSKHISSEEKTTSTTKTTTTKTSSPKSSTKSTLQNNTNDGRTIYGTPTGKRYHFDPNCGGKNSRVITNKSGLTPCQKCAK